MGLTGAASNIDIRIGEYDEVIPCRTSGTRYHSERQRGDSDIMAQNNGRLRVYLVEYGKILDIREGCILLRMMLITAESLEHYKDPEQRKVLEEKVKQMLKTLRQENNLDFSDVDGIKIQISDEDIQKAESFFKIGKYN